MHPVGLPQTTWALKFSLFSEYDKIIRGVFSFPLPTFQFPKRISLNFWVLYIFFTSANPLPALVHHHGCLNYAVCVLSKPRTLCTFDLTSFIWDLKCFNDIAVVALFIYCCHSKLFPPLRSVGLTFKWNFPQKLIEVRVWHFLVKANYFQWRLTELNM